MAILRRDSRAPRVPPRRPGLLGSHLRTRIRYAPLALAPATVTRPRRLAATGPTTSARALRCVCALAQRRAGDSIPGGCTIARQPTHPTHPRMSLESHRSAAQRSRLQRCAAAPAACLAAHARHRTCAPIQATLPAVGAGREHRRSRHIPSCASLDHAQPSTASRTKSISLSWPSVSLYPF